MGIVENENATDDIASKNAIEKRRRWYGLDHFVLSDRTSYNIQELPMKEIGPEMWGIMERTFFWVSVNVTDILFHEADDMLRATWAVFQAPSSDVLW